MEPDSRESQIRGLTRSLLRGIDVHPTPAGWNELGASMRPSRLLKCKYVWLCSQVVTSYLFRIWSRLTRRCDRSVHWKLMDQVVCKRLHLRVVEDQGITGNTCTLLEPADELGHHQRVHANLVEISIERNAFRIIKPERLRNFASQQRREGRYALCRRKMTERLHPWRGRRRPVGLP